MSYQYTYLCPECGEAYQNAHECTMPVGPRTALRMSITELNLRLNKVEEKLEDVLTLLTNPSYTMHLESNGQCGYGPNPKQRLEIHSEDKDIIFNMDSWPSGKVPETKLHIKPTPEVKYGPRHEDYKKRIEATPILEGQDAIDFCEKIAREEGVKHPWCKESTPKHNCGNCCSMERLVKGGGVCMNARHIGTRLEDYFFCDDWSEA